jgi:hypothetical protein
MTAHNLAEAKELQRKTTEKVKVHIRQSPVSSVRMLDDGNWAVQLRFPRAISAQEQQFLVSLEKENDIVILVEDKVGNIRQLVR